MNHVSKPGQQIVTEPALVHEFFQVSVGRRNDENIDTPELGATNPADLSRVEESEELGLERGNDISNLVEKQDTTVCDLQAPFLVLRCFSEGPFDMTKQFRLDEGWGQRRDWHREVGCTRTVAGRRVRPREELFAGTRFAA